MQAETWQQVSTLVARALELPTSDRQRFLDEACPEDGQVRREVEALLSYDSQVLSETDRPVFELFAPPADGGGSRNRGEP